MLPSLYYLHDLRLPVFNMTIKKDLIYGCENLKKLFGKNRRW